MPTTVIPVTKYEIGGIPYFTFPFRRAFVNASDLATVHLPPQFLGDQLRIHTGEMALARTEHNPPLAIFVSGYSPNEPARMNHHACHLKPSPGGVSFQVNPKTLYYTLAEFGLYLVELGETTYVYEVSA